VTRFFDTNILLKRCNLDMIKMLNWRFCISSQTLKELEKIKQANGRDTDLQSAARSAIRFLKEHGWMWDVEVVTNNHFEILRDYNLPITPDNIILSCAEARSQKDEDTHFYSDDILCSIMAREIFTIPLGAIPSAIHHEYTGYSTAILDDDSLAALYSSMNENHFNCHINEYFVIQNEDGEIIDKLKWDGRSFRSISYKKIDNAYVGKIKPRNAQQELALDLLYDEATKVKALFGIAGSGKDMLMASVALDLLARRKFDKIIWVRNNIEVANTKQIGFLPGTTNEKLKPFVMPFADHVGGEDGLDMLISQGKVVVEHFGTIRGRDFKNAIVICSEAENTTREHMQLLISRISEGSELWINGDINQIDSDVFKAKNGLLSVVDRLKGNKLFGCVKLNKTERSDVAELAAMLG